MIGIFDSGIGGLTVAKAVMDRLKGYDILYFGDTARTPYGNKSRETVTLYAKEDTRFLLDRGAKIIVIACNTASSIAKDQIRNQFDVPVFEVILPAVEEAVQVSKTGRIGVIGTRATISSGIYQKEIIAKNPESRIFTRACPLLVPLVEEGWMKKPETRMIVKKYLLPLKQKRIDTLILGCTHYPILKDLIQKKIGKQVKVIDSASSVARKIDSFFSMHPDFAKTMSQTGRSRFFVTDITDQFEKTAGIILKNRMKYESVRLDSLRMQDL